MEDLPAIAFVHMLFEDHHRFLFFSASNPIAIARLAMSLRWLPSSFLAIASNSASQRAGTLRVYATSLVSDALGGVFFLLEGMRTSYQVIRDRSRSLT